MILPDFNLLLHAYSSHSPVHAVAPILFGFLRSAGVGGNLTTDAHLAALAVEHDLEVYTTDTDFARFPGLRWKNPLVAG